MTITITLADADDRSGWPARSNVGTADYTFPGVPGSGAALTFNGVGILINAGSATVINQGGRIMSFGARVLLLLVLLVTALDPAVAHATQRRDFAGLVDVGGGRRMYLECRGMGSPTVVLVAGLRGSAEDWSIADKSPPAVFPEVAKFPRVCAYDRPGTPVGEKPSRSDPVPQPTTAATAVADLH